MSTNDPVMSATDPVTQARIEEALGAIAAAADRYTAAGATVTEASAALLLYAARGASHVGATAEQFEEAARLAWAEMRRTRGAR